MRESSLSGTDIRVKNTLLYRLKNKEGFIMNENTNKKEGLTNKEKLMLAGGLAVSTGLAVMGFKLGGKWEGYKIGLGLKKCCEADPTLKGHLWEAMGKVYEMNN